MNLKSAVVLGLLFFVLAPVLSDDLSGAGDDSPLTKTSGDHRIKVTLLYVGPVNDTQFRSPFVVVYLREDCRSDEDYERNHITFSKEGYETGGGEYLLRTSIPEIKDGSRRLLTDSAEERCRGYDGASETSFKTLYPNVKVPSVEHPKRADIFEYFFKSVAKGPFDITLHDHFTAYGENSFHFRDVDFSAPSAN